MFVAFHYWHHALVCFTCTHMVAFPVLLFFILHSTSTLSYAYPSPVSMGFVNHVCVCVCVCVCACARACVCVWCKQQGSRSQFKGPSTLCGADDRRAPQVKHGGVRGLPLMAFDSATLKHQVCFKTIAPWQLVMWPGCSRPSDSARIVLPPLSNELWKRWCGKKDPPSCSVTHSCSASSPD